MYQTIIVIQYVSIIALFIESWIVFKKLDTRLHAYLLFACVSNLINNIGYLFELKAKTMETYITALQISYVGRVWIAFALFLFVSQMCGLKLNNIVKTGLAVCHTAIYIVVLTIPNNELYYKNLRFEMNGEIPNFIFDGGVVHYVFTVMLILYIAAGLIMMFMAYFKEKDRTAKKRFMTVIVALVIESVFSILSRFNSLEISNDYDLSMLGFTIGSIIMLYGIFRYKLLGTEQLAKDFITEKLSDGIVAADPEGKVAYFNKPAEKLFPELGTDPSGVVRRIDTSIKEGEPIQLGGHIYTPKTETLFDKGEVSATVYVIQDNTEIYKHAEELEKMAERANAANKAKSRFLSSMSHEIRTPINAVLGMDEMILRESTESDILAYAEDIRNAGSTLLSLVNDILDFSKIEEGKMEIITTRYELASLISDLVNMVNYRAEKKGLKFETDVDPNIPFLLCGDEIRIKQCILNILTNAVKYTEKGSVTFTVGFAERDSEHIDLKISVKDTGIGMKSEDLEKLFSPFARLEQERNMNIEGTGLGMSITKRLLSLMDSSLEVSSVYGEGSEFSFSLKQQIADKQPIGDYSARRLKDTAHTAYREAFRAPDAKILVVDDTPMNLAVIKGLLKKTKINVDTAGSGREALKAAASEKYDVIFIDHMMPEMDGIETLHELRRFPVNAGTVCVALTANAISGAKEMYLSEGFTDYLSKPVDSKKLETMLAQYLPPEKLLPAQDEAPPAPAPGPAEDNSALGRIRRVNGIDTKKGLEYCGDEELYIDTISFFASSVKANADEIENLWNSGDVKGAVIKIHALKSTSRIIGAFRLSEFARRLETAGKNGETDIIADELSLLLGEYRALGTALAEFATGETHDDDSEIMIFEPENAVDE